MKNIISTKMSSMRKRSALSSSAADAVSTREVNPSGVVPKEPSSHHGKMRLCIDGTDPSSALDATDDLVDIVLCISIDSLHVVADLDNTIVFEVDFRSIKEIVWDHTECSVCFVLEGDLRSSTFVFVSTLVEVEAQISSALRSSGLTHAPDQVYVGVLVGRNLPSSPIHQRRASVVGAGVQPVPSLPAALRHELLAHERPPRFISPREKLAMQYFRSGELSFPCSINGDARGLKLDGSYLYVYPSPDGHDRSACLFSYQYEQVDSCEVRGGMRLELRFRRSGAKQPTFIAFQSTDAQYIRDAIWYYQHDVPMDEYFRRAPISETKSLKETTGAPTLSMPPRRPPSRRSSFKSFQDEDSFRKQILSRCIVVGCNRRCADLSSACIHECPGIGSNGITTRRKVWFCEDHAPVTNEPGSPPRSPSKRHGLLSRGKSTVLTPRLVHSAHYMQSVKYHSTLLKSGGKYNLTKSWNQKIAALINTPLGGFLCYYDKLAHCPGQSESAPKERRIIDLSGVICVRRERAASTTGSQPYAFDIVTVYRTWTFAAIDLQEFELWLNILGEAIEKQSSMSPDKPLRFPVKCLLDPLHNLPSRSDGSTALEVSSNGVTVCAGTDGDSEVYNWYFTDIQKWSVAKQQDSSPCCFISCAVGPIDAKNPNTASSRYQDFLFQTPDAEAICSAIEFFVGRCMAKLEVLTLMHMHAQHRQPSRRPSLESGSQKPAGYAPQPVPRIGTSETCFSISDEKNGKVSSGKELPMAAVPLRSVGITPTASDSKYDQQAASFGSLTPPSSANNTSETKDDLQPPFAACAPLVLKESDTAGMVGLCAWSKRQPLTPTQEETRSGEPIHVFEVEDAATGVERLSCEVKVDDVQLLPLISPVHANTSEPQTDVTRLTSTSNETTVVQDRQLGSEDGQNLHEGDDTRIVCESHDICETIQEDNPICDADSAPLTQAITDSADSGLACGSTSPSSFCDMSEPAVAVDDENVQSDTLCICDAPIECCLDDNEESLSDSHVQGGVRDKGAIGIESFSTSEDAGDYQVNEGTDSDPSSLPVFANVDAVVVEGEDERTVDSPQQDVPAPHLTTQLRLLSDEPSITLAAGDLKNCGDDEDADSDRFVSFEYCECIVGDVEDRVTPIPHEADSDEGTCDDDAFVDARCDLLITTESSVVVLDGGCWNDEDSLVVLEDEESGRFEIDAVGDFTAVHDPIDELDYACDGEESQVDADLY